MIFAVLVVVWVVALTPYALRKLGEWQVSSELNRFRRGLGVLRQFSPQPDPAVSNPATVSAADPSVTDPRRQRPNRAERERAAQLVMRRRRTLTWLGASLCGSFVIGAIPMFRVLWDLSLFVLVLTAVYVSALVWVQRQAVLAAEREAKIVRLRALRNPESALAEVVRGDRVVPRLVAVATAAGGSRGAYASVVDLPRRPAFVLVEAPS